MRILEFAPFTLQPQCAAKRTQCPSEAKRILEFASSTQILEYTNSPKFGSSLKGTEAKRSALWRRKLSAAETNPFQRLCSMGVGRFVYIDKMFSRRFVDSIINKRNTPTPCRDLSAPPPHWGVFTPLVLPPITKYPHWGYTTTHTHWSDQPPPPPHQRILYKSLTTSLFKLYP